jgi:PAS domain S-box-containing protein
MVTTRQESVEARAYVRPLRLGAAFIALACAIWELARQPLPPGVAASLWTARAVGVAVAIAVGLLADVRRPLRLLRFLALALLLDVVLQNVALVHYAPDAHEEATIFIVAALLAGALFAPWSWRWQALLVAFVTPLAVAVVSRWGAPERSGWADGYEVAAVLTAAFVSVLGAHLKFRDRQRIAASEDRYHGIFDGAGDAIAVLRPGGAIREGNPSLARLLGLPLQQILGRRLTDFVSDAVEQPASITSLTGEMAAARTSESSIAPGTLTRADGTSVEVEVTFSRATTLEGPVLQAIVRDLTHQRAAERREADRQRMDAIARVSAGLAHQFNNLLSGVLTNAELLRADAPNVESAAQLEEIADAARRGRQLTKSLVRYTGHDAVTLQPTPPNTVLESVATLARVTVPMETVIAVAAPADLPAMAADADQLVQACHELVMNAGRALQGRPSPALTLEAALETIADPGAEWPGAGPGRYVRITVTDNGVGMDEATRRHIFEPFFTTRPMAEAAGLGLAGVFWVVRTHHGSIRVNSIPGRGTSVHLIIPVASVSAPVSAPAPGGPPTVLLVDDEAIVRSTLRRVLTRMGYLVLEAADGPAAVTAMRSASPAVSLVILDIVLPGGGVGLLRQLREVHPDVRVLVSSGYGPEGEAAKLLIEGADGFLQKPYEIAELKAALEQALGARPIPGS